VISKKRGGKWKTRATMEWSQVTVMADQKAGREKKYPIRGQGERQRCTSVQEEDNSKLHTAQKARRNEEISA